MIPLLIIRQKVYKSRRDCHWDHTVRTLENHITLFFFLSGYTVWLRHISSSPATALPSAWHHPTVWSGAERMHVESENNFCVSWFSSSALFWGRVFHPAAGALKRASGQGSHLQLLRHRDELGIQMHSTACTWLPCGPRGMNLDCWVFIADSSVLPTQLSPWTGPNLHFLTTLHFTCCHVPFLPEKLWFSLSPVYF